MGQFRWPINQDSLLADFPSELWAGFMLPDTLPVVGNDYGDWLCLRVAADDTISEVVHWQHGGGDWVPYGRNLAEALLLDCVCVARPYLGYGSRTGQQEFNPALTIPLSNQLDVDTFIQWNASALGSSVNQVGEILSFARQGKFESALDHLLAHDWAADAATIERILCYLQRQSSKLADTRIARSLGINWEPDYNKWLFDLSQVPADSWQAICQIATSLDDAWHPVSQMIQEWDQAANLALRRLHVRSDLGWAFDIVGWNQLRDGRVDDAAQTFFDGRFASAFTDQSVRLRSHWFDSQFAKFCSAQLWSLRESRSILWRDDSYLNVLWQTQPDMLSHNVCQFWLTRARRELAEGDLASAYKSFYRAGWDLGADRLSTYVEILQGLIETANRAGWQARAEVALTHLAALSQKLTRRRNESE